MNVVVCVLRSDGGGGGGRVGGGGGEAGRREGKHVDNAADKQAKKKKYISKQ